MPRSAFAVAAFLMLAGPATAQQQAPGWVDRWFWGAEAGLLWYGTNVQDMAFDPIVGGHWLITARRSALYLSYEQAFFLEDATAGIPDASGTHTATFKQFRRISAALLAMPIDPVLRPYAGLQPYAGIGVAIQQVISPETTPAIAGQEGRAQSLANDRASSAAFLFVGGLNLYFGPLVLFGQYKTTAGPANFLLDDINHAFQGGIRFNVVSRKEEISGNE